MRCGTYKLTLDREVDLLVTSDTVILSITIVVVIATVVGTYFWRRSERKKREAGANKYQAKGPEG